MNILASYNWIKEYLKTDATPEEFARELSLRGPGVEKIITSAAAFKHIVVGKLVSVDAHPNADKLRVCKVDVGAKSLQQIVCGGSNLAVGQLVAVALPGASVRWHGQGEPIVLASAELRGVKSDGMICASDEIGLGAMFPSKDKEVMNLSATKAKPGVSVATAVGLEDPILDIEATTNRPDCFAIVGLALEASASGLGKFTMAPPKVLKAKKVRDGLKVTIEDKKLCPRYMAAVLREVKVGPSPAWLAARLTQAGVRPINNVVDVTNYVMLEYGNPLHAFDRAAVLGDVINVRRAKKGEAFMALDGKTYSLTAENLVIANAKSPMALAGVMGGEASGTTEKTISVVLEAAAFDAVSVRRTSRSHALITDASLRFEKGLSSFGCELALARAVELLQRVSPSAEVTEVVDVYPVKAKMHTFGYRPEYAEALIGAKIPAQQQKKILESLMFRVSAKGKKWSVEVPHWREFDIEGERDLVEEVARIYGYHKIAPVMPAGFGNQESRIKNQEFYWTDEIKRFMEATGWTELMTYAYTNAAAYKVVGRSIDQLLAVSNPLSSDFTHLRDMLLPNMLTVVRENQERFPCENVYEIGNCFMPQKSGLPIEHLRYTALSYGHDAEAFSMIKGLLETLAVKFGFVDIELVRTEKPDNVIFHPGRSAAIRVKGDMVGVVGEVAPDVLQRAGITKRAGVLSLDLAKLLPHLTMAKAFKGISEYPSVLRDVSFVVAEKVTHADLVKAFLGVDAQVVGAERFDEYRGKEIGVGKKSLAYHLEFRSDAGTLTTELADALLAKVRAVLQSKFAAEVRS